MKQTSAERLLLPHLLLAALVFITVCLPKRRPAVAGPAAFLTAIAIIEALFLRAVFRRRKSARQQKNTGTGAFDIVCLLWVLLAAWELSASVLNVAHPVLVPSPENVFATFTAQWDVILRNIASSLSLLAAGFSLGLVSATGLGLAAGWYPRLRAFACPIASVMAPIPPIVISPYLVALAPSFRSASLLVIVLGVFWPSFLNTVNRVTAMEPHILDSARTLVSSPGVMLWQILLPYILPGVVSGLKVSLSTSLLMLNFAELMGATHGMGYYVQNSVAYANYTHAAAGILVTGIAAALLSWLAGLLQECLIKWH